MRTRPPLPEGVKLSEVLPKFRVTKQVADAVDRVAVRRGVSVAAAVREILHAGLIARGDLVAIPEGKTA